MSICQAYEYLICSKSHYAAWFVGTEIFVSTLSFSTMTVMPIIIPLQKQIMSEANKINKIVIYIVFLVIPSLAFQVSFFKKGRSGMSAKLWFP